MNVLFCLILYDNSISALIVAVNSSKMPVEIKNSRPGSQTVARQDILEIHPFTTNHFYPYFLKGQSTHARVAELADALDLGSSGETRAGSSPVSRTGKDLRRIDVSPFLLTVTKNMIRT